MEEIRCKAVERGTGNEHYKTTGIATIEVFLPARLKKVSRFPRFTNVFMLSYLSDVIKEIMSSF